MSRIKSIFGAYADRLQVMVDNSLDRYAPTFFDRYFTFGTPQATLTYGTVIGASRVEAAASVVSRGSAMPIRARGMLTKLTGEIPAIGEKFSMKESDYRDFLMLQQITIDDTTKLNSLLNFLYGDLSKAGNAAMKRLDIMCLDGLYTGKISLNVTNNPDGVINATDIDLLQPAENVNAATAAWSDATNAKPLTDIKNAVREARAKGITLAKILMSDAAFLEMTATTEVKDNLANWLRMTTNKVMPTEETVNQFLTAHRLPTIEIVDEVIGIEKDGVITTIRPFGDDAVVLIPAGNLGTIKNALAMEQITPVPNVAYATFRNALLSKWQENEPFNEWTKVELNACPSFEAIDQIYRITI